MKAIALASAMLVLSAASALGQEDPPIDCKNAITQADMNSCAAMEWSEADDKLNAVYKQALKSQEKLDRDNGEISKDYVGAVAALKKAQRAWIDYRDGHCDGLSFQVAGGSVQSQVINGCATQLTKARTKEVQELINGMGN